MKKRMAFILGLFALGSMAFASPEFKLSVGDGLEGYTNFLAYKTTLSGNYVYTDTGGATEYKTIMDAIMWAGMCSLTPHTRKRV